MTWKGGGYNMTTYVCDCHFASRSEARFLLAYQAVEKDFVAQSSFFKILDTYMFPLGFLGAARSLFIVTEQYNK